MELIDKKEHLCSLYDLYKNLLTETQRKYFEDYYFLDLSLSEVGESYDVSRSAVYDQVKRIEGILEGFESALHLFEKEEKLEKLLSEYEDNSECVELINKIRNME